MQGDIRKRQGTVLWNTGTVLRSRLAWNEEPSPIPQNRPLSFFCLMKNQRVMISTGTSRILATFRMVSICLPVAAAK